MTQLHLQEILDLPMGKNDADAKDIRGYLKALLSELWAEGEGFSGKRPFGNSGWEFELYSTLIKGGAIKGKISEDEYSSCVEELSDVERKKANKLIQSCIDAL